ncbi:DUF3263 domain-containing protein [Micromonospora sp. NPDC047548]|uniref:DUF3263 domain-containing protein n=1 Tax=Micromonospora sp. NPDC047548 TaxID=3155624 RepID=UPI0034045803
MPADASAAATDRPELSGRATTPEPSGRATTDERPGAVVPPPRSAPPVEDTPVQDAPEPGDTATVPADAADYAPGPDGPPVGTAGEPVPAQRGPADRATADTLTEREQRILAFEQQWWKHAGAKEQAVRDTFGLSATRYYQLLNALLDRPAALAAEPVLIGRLRRLRSSRTRNRRR